MRAPCAENNSVVEDVLEAGIADRIGVEQGGQVGDFDGDQQAVAAESVSREAA